jgi:hypothetical protein
MGCLAENVQNAKSNQSPLALAKPVGLKGGEDGAAENCQVTCGVA